MSNEDRLRRLIGDDAFDALTPREQQELIAGDGVWIEQLLLTRDTLPLAEPPALLSQSLRDIFDQHRLVQSYEAVLVSDSRTDRRLVGVRGGSDSSAWSLTYTCEAADIVIDVTPDQDRVLVDAHVLSHGNLAQAYRADVRPTKATDADPPPAVESDRLGRVQLGALQQQPYQLTFRNLRSVIELAVDFTPEPS